MRTGFDDPEPEDREPEALAEWLAGGFTAEGAEVWRRWRFSIERAQAWMQAGVEEGLHAAQWSTAGALPDTVAKWRAAGIDATEAVRWHEFGFALEAAQFEKAKGNGPDQAFASAQPAPSVATTSRMMRSGGVSRGYGGPLRGFHEAGVDHRIMHSYAQHQWMDESALLWAKQGIEATDAYAWHDLGLTPVEAGRLELLGRTSSDVVREWWSAGIPFEEFADWIGAGLSAPEAVEQRARGITAEHAASLRALRLDDDAPQVRPTGRNLALFVRQGPPSAERVGPPPDDEEAARAQIAEAFSAMLIGDEASNSIPAVHGSENLGDCLREAAERNAAAAENSTATIAVDLVRFLNDHEARVSYSVVVSGGINMHFGDRPGKAVLVNGTWKVDRETFCQMIQMAGVQCPPPSR